MKGKNMIDFNTMALKALEGFKGGEGQLDAKMFADDSVKILKASLAKGSTVGLHAHEDSCEVIYFLAGEGDHVLDDVAEHVSAGQCAYCPKGHAHTLIATSEEPLEFFAVVPQQ